MADLGFDFSDDHDDYQQYEEHYEDDDNVSILPPSPPSAAANTTSTLKQQQQQQQQQQHDGSNNTSNHNTSSDTSKQSEQETNASLNGTESQNGTLMEDARQLETDLPPFEEDDDNDQDEQEQSYSDIYTKETNLLLASNRLLKAPEEGYNTDSLLDAILTEEVNEDDMEEGMMADMDESLTAVERVYKYSKSSVVFHRQLVAKDLPIALEDVDVSEAVTDMFPLVLQVAHDDDESVRETFASELDKIIMYFYKNAPPLMGDNASSPTFDQSTQQHMEAPTRNSNETAYNEDQNGTKDLEREKPASSVNPQSSTTQQHTTENQSDTTTDNSTEQSNEKNTTASTQHHIPNKAFAPLLIELLLDQNSNLASLGQQCIVAMAAELASTPPDSDRAALDQFLLDTEIYDGVVMGLMDIVHDKASIHHVAGDEETLSANLSATSIGAIQRRASATPGFDSASSTTMVLDDDSRQGEINLAKMMCLTLISALTVVLGATWATQFSLPIVEQLAPDPMFYVRKEAAAAIGSVATVVDMDVATNRLLPLYLELSRDTIWHVRRSCVLTLPLLCQVLPDDTKTKIAIEGVELFKNDVSRNVRNTLAEVIGELITKFLPEDWKESGRPGPVPDPLLDFFLSLGTAGNANQMFKMETDRTIICAYNFPAVVLTVGAGYWDSHLKDTYLSLTKDYQIKVRRTFAYSLHEIARIIGPERTESDLVQIFALYLMDLDDVKQGVLEHLAEFLGTLTVHSRNEYIPILTEVWDGVMTNWRLRDILAAQLREIALLFDAARVVEHILPLAIRACHDEFAAVRRTVVDAFPVILDIVKRAVDDQGEHLIQDEDDDTGSDDEEDDEETKENKRNFALALLNHVIERLDEFVRSNAHRDRLVFAQICQSLLEAGISATDFASFFLSRLVPLTVDSIVNVRISAARTLRKIYLNNSYRQELDDWMAQDDEEEITESLLDQMVYRLALDEDMDVRHFVEDLVDPDRLEEKKQEFLTEQMQQRHHFHQQDDDDDGSDVDDTQYVDTSSTLLTKFPSTDSSTGHHLMRKILSDETDDETIAVHPPTLEHNKPNGTSNNESMDCTEDGSDKKQQDEDGDALMMDVQKDEDDEEPAMIGDDDDDPDSALTDEKEKGEYVYLTKTGTHEPILATSPSLDKKAAV